MFEPQKPKQPSEDAIIVKDVSKRFRIPNEKKSKFFDHVASILKGSSSGYDEFQALEDISFRVKKGAPFLELGVGFQPELKAEEKCEIIRRCHEDEKK